MVRWNLFVAAVALVAVPVLAADTPKKLSDEQKKVIAAYTKSMEKDYVGLIVNRAGHPPDGLERADLEAWVKKRGDIALKFVKKEIANRSRKRLVALVAGMSAAEVRRRNEVMNKPITDLTKQELKEVDAWFEKIEKIEDAVLGEIPASKFPKFD